MDEIDRLRQLVRQALASQGELIAAQTASIAKLKAIMVDQGLHILAMERRVKELEAISPDKTTAPIGESPLKAAYPAFCTLKMIEAVRAITPSDADREMFRRELEARKNRPKSDKPDTLDLPESGNVVLTVYGTPEIASGIREGSCYADSYARKQEEDKVATATPTPPARTCERFTDRARRVMRLANQEAQRLNHEYIGTEHVLLGIIKEGGGVAAQVLKNLDIDLRKIRLEVEKLVAPGPDMVTMGRLPQTPNTKAAIAFAIEEAAAMGHSYVGTEHLLLGLLRVQGGVACAVLVKLIVTADPVGTVRAEVLTCMGRKADGTVHEPAAPADPAPLQPEIADGATEYTRDHPCGDCAANDPPTEAPTSAEESVRPRVTRGGWF